MVTGLASRLAATVRTFRTDPGAGQSSPTVTATLVDGHASLASGRFRWDSDLESAVGGQDLAPSPTAYLLGALAGCGVVFLHDTLAPLFDVTLDDVVATARCRSDAAGLLGIEGAPPALQEIELGITVTSPDPANRVEAMFAVWRERCPIFLALSQPSPTTLRFEIVAAGTRR